MPKIDLYALPKDVLASSLIDSAVIVIDLLRASTTICTALAAGAECVMPFAEIDETLAAAERFGRQNVMLGGERHGKLIPGFDLGNSPFEYTSQAVAGRRILFSTTNGACALHHARWSKRVLVGAAVNRTAVALALKLDSDVAILCAGTDGEFAREDFLAGGAIIEAICSIETRPTLALDTRSASALAAWTELANAQSLTDRFAAELLDTQGGRNLVEIGNDADLPACAKIDLLTVVPELNPASNEIRPA